jgi:TonB family protein
MTLLLTSSIKVSVILLFAFGATALLRKRSAATRHLVLSAAVLCAVALPAVEWVVPSWHLRVDTSSLGRVERRQQQLPAMETRPQGVLDAVRHDGFSAVRPLMDGEVAGALWIAGVTISLFVLLVGLGRLAWIASRAQRIVRGPWTELAREIASRYSLHRPVLLLQSDHPTMLVTWGLVRPRVFLPQSARDWPEDRVRVVLCHELAHIRRGDWAIQMAAEVLRSVYWFNPLVWIACRRLRRDSEQACDDAVLSLGVEGPEYATHLLDLARAFESRRPVWLPAPEMARPSSLEGRIRAMLNNGIDRQPVARRASLVAVIAILAVTVAVAAAQTFATLSGSVFDPTNSILPEVTLVLTNVESKAKHEVRSDRTGHFEFVGLPRGEYALEARLLGFAALHGTVVVSGQNVQRDMTLQVGSLQETITVVGGPSTGTPRPPDAGSRIEQLREKRRQQFDLRCQNTPAGGTVAGNIGGNLRPPMKLKDVKPQYPQHLQDANIAGLVSLEGRIGTDGSFTELRVVTSAHPDLDAAALEAVRQWQFDETLLNCVPVEVPMNIAVTFKTQQ